MIRAYDIRVIPGGPKTRGDLTELSFKDATHVEFDPKNRSLSFKQGSESDPVSFISWGLNDIASITPKGEL